MLRTRHYSRIDRVTSCWALFNPLFHYDIFFMDVAPLHTDHPLIGPGMDRMVFQVYLRMSDVLQLQVDDQSGRCHDSNYVFLT